MFRLFKTKPLLSTNAAMFEIETYKWLLRNFDEEFFYNKTSMVLPTPDFFPSKVNSDEEAAIETFNTVKELAGLSEWPCKLVPQENDIDPLVAPTIMVKNLPNNPLGTFSVQEDNEVIITYNPAIVNKPVQLIATYAHELSHYLIRTAKEAPPGGWDNEELVADITATFLGFGVFMVNSATHFEQFSGPDSQGFTSGRSGYLSEKEHTYALAIFMHLKGIEYNTVKPYVKSYLRSTLKKAMKELNG